MDVQVQFGGIKSGEIPAPIIRAEDRQWHPLGDEYPGIDKVLNVDEQRHTVHSMARMAPGSSFPLHQHTGNAYVYTVKGSWDYEEGHMPEGSFVMEHKDSVHTPITKDGCILMVQLCSDTNDILAQDDGEGGTFMLDLDFFQQYQ
jgi:anti-sigma factor ChrR (cupin superfamily)